MYYRISSLLLLLFLAKSTWTSKLPSCCSDCSDCLNKFFRYHLKYDCSSCPWDALIERYHVNTKSIGFAGIYIESLPEDAFAKFPNLTTLLLRIPLKNIHQNAFKGLTKLRFLDMWTFTTDLTRQFSSIPLLQELRLLCLNDRHPDEAIATLTNLRRLVISGDNKPFSPKLKSLTKLRTLVVNKGNLTLQSDLFLPFRDIPLKTLMIQRLAVTHVSHDAFSHLDALENLVICNVRSSNSALDLLKELMTAIQYIPSNNLTTLSVDCILPALSHFTFNISTSTTPYSQLRRMNFRANSVHNLGLQSLLTLSNLTYLSLARSRMIGQTPEDDMNNLIANAQKMKLARLDLSGYNTGRTSCHDMKPSCYSPSISPDDLFPEEHDEVEASSSEQESIQAPRYTNKSIIPMLDFQKNLDAIYPSDDDFNYPFPYDKRSIIMYYFLLHNTPFVKMQGTNLAHFILEHPLGMQNSHLRFLDVSNNFIFETQTSWNFTDMRSLSHLNLSRNSMSTIPDDLANVHGLVSLDLSHNRLRTENFDSIFQNMKQLKYLLLQGNSIASLPMDAFASLNNLHQLWLNDNNLKTANFKLPLTQSLQVHMSNNRMSSFTKSFTDSVDAFLNNNYNISIDATKNIFQCTCAMIDFIKWLRKTRVNIKDKKEYICHLDASKPTLLTVNLQKVRKTCGSPIDKTLVLPAILIPVGTILVLIIIAWCYCNRWTVRWYAYQVQQAVPFTAAYRQKREAELQLVENKDYDVAVIYDLQDEKYARWIRETLVPILEGWNLQVFYMDDLDKNPVKAFESVVESCRSFLFVLTSNFLDQDLCHKAMYMVLPSHLQAIYFCELEKIPESKYTFTPVLHRIKASSPTFTYPQELENLPTFLNKLSKALVYKRSDSCMI